jgi:hypothetical protein
MNSGNRSDMLKRSVQDDKKNVRRLVLCRKSKNLGKIKKGQCLDFVSGFLGWETLSSAGEEEGF